MAATAGATNIFNKMQTAGVGGITSPSQLDEMRFMDDDYVSPSTGWTNTDKTRDEVDIRPPVTTTTTTTTNNTERNGFEHTNTTTNTTDTTTTTTHTEGGSTGVSTATGDVSEETQQQYDKYSGDYVESENVTDAYNQLQDQINSKPGEFNSQYTDNLNALYEQIMNRNPFNYSLKDDALFDIYKQRYDAAGETAMKDTQGQYAANTGGYANSAGETAGYAAYQGYMNELQNTIPELYTMAYNRYKDQVDMDFNKYDITKGREDSDYSRYRDQLADWQTDRDFFQNQYESERNFDYKQWDDYRDFWQNELWNERNSEWTTNEKNWSNEVHQTTNHHTSDTQTDRFWHEDPWTSTTVTTTTTR